MKKQLMCNDSGQQQLILPQRHKDTEEKDRFFRSYETLLNAVQSLRAQGKTALTQGQL